MKKDLFVQSLEGRVWLARRKMIEEEKHLTEKILKVQKKIKQEVASPNEELS